MIPFVGRMQRVAARSLLRFLGGISFRLPAKGVLPPGPSDWEAKEALWRLARLVPQNHPSGGLSRGPVGEFRRMKWEYAYHWGLGLEGKGWLWEMGRPG